ncbi:MAG: 5-formyltetrahydrofolate cyclo-ligase [Candidatus Omnitrophota bacterium]
MTKNQIRSKILLELKKQKEEERKRKSRIIKEKLFNNLFFKKAKTVMFYIALDGEVDTTEMIKQARRLGKTIAVPVCGKARLMRPCLFGPRARLSKGPYGISEPAIKKFIDLKDLDLVVVPGLSFDRRGMRLGRGKGYYDYFLKKIPKAAFSIGLAFGFQVLPYLPSARHDVAVKELIFA